MYSEKTTHLLHKPFVNEVYLTGKNLTKNCSKPLDFWYTFLKGLNLKNTVNIGSLD